MHGRYVLNACCKRCSFSSACPSSTFIVGHLTGDPVAAAWLPRSARGGEGAAAQFLGLDRPMPEQYSPSSPGPFRATSAIPSFRRSGVSIWCSSECRRPSSLPWWPSSCRSLAVPLGIIIALKRNTVWDFVVTALAMVGQAAPGFWIGLMLIIVFAVELKLLPVSGYGGVEYIVLPAVTLALQSAARLTRLVRASVLEVLGSDYIRTARAKGMRDHVGAVGSHVSECDDPGGHHGRPGARGTGVRRLHHRDDLRLARPRPPRRWTPCTSAISRLSRASFSLRRRASCS